MPTPYDLLLAGMGVRPGSSPYDSQLAQRGLEAPLGASVYLKNRLTGGGRSGFSSSTFNPYNPETLAYLNQLNPPKVSITVPGRQAVPYQQSVTDPISDIQANLQRDIDMPVVQQGSHVLSDDEIQQRQEVAQSAAQTLQTLQPLVQQGLLGNNFISHAIGQSVGQSLDTQRDRTAAGRDLRAINKAYREGTITDSNYNEALTQVQKKYGQATLFSVPEYAASQNSLHELASTRNVQIQQWEQQNNAPGLGGWDEENNRPSIDHHKLSDQYSLSLLRGQEAKARKDAAQPLIDIGKNEKALAKAKLDFRLHQSDELMRSARTLNKDNPARQQQEIAGLMNQRQAWFNEYKQTIGSTNADITSAPSTLIKTNPTVIPTSTPIYKTVGHFNDPTALNDAVKSGSVKPGDYISIPGGTARIRSDGSFEPVK